MGKGHEFISNDCNEAKEVVSFNYETHVAIFQDNIEYLDTFFTIGSSVSYVTIAVRTENFSKTV